VITSVTTTKGSCTHTKKTVTCHLGTLAKNQTVTITIVVRATSAGKLTLRSKVTATQPDATPADNSRTVTINVIAPCAAVFQVDYDNDDALVEVRTYIDGRRTHRVTGSHISRRVVIKGVPQHGSHVLKVFARLSDRRRVEFTRRYHGCRHGRTHRHVIPTRNIIKEP
jgi:hypothetical protein